jgi:site-specific recombinase XerD
VEDIKRYEKYLDGFFEETKLSKGEQENYLSLIRKIEKLDKFITDWTNDDLDKFILSIESISVNSVNKYLQYVRNFYLYVCRIDNVPTRRLYLAKDLSCYINYDKLFEKTLDEQAYRWIKNLLAVPTWKGDMNFRDKVLFELAWEGLDSEEIKNLLVDDIEIDEDNGVAKIKLKDRTLEIRNEEVVYDIIQTIKQDEYYVYPTTNRKEQFRRLKPTPYLIKPVMTRSSKSETVRNPSLLLKNAFSKIEEDIPGINLEKLSLEDIRRSRILKMLKEGAEISDIKKFIDKQSECDLYWLQEIAALMNEKDKEKRGES